MKQIKKIQTIEELYKRRENSRILMATLAALFFAWLIIVYKVRAVSLGYLGFVFLFLAILKYIDMRYYDLVIRIKGGNKNEIQEKRDRGF